MLKSAAGVVAGMVLLTCVAVGQDERFDVSVGGFGAFSQSTQGNGISLNPTQAVGFVGTVRMKVGNRSALALNYGRNKNSQVYTTSTVFRVLSTVTEVSGAYTFMPFQREKLHPFLFLGAGGLFFAPTDTLIKVFDSNGNLVTETSTPIGAVRRASLAGLYGGGVDYHLYSAFSLRMQYRGLIYKSPDYNVGILFTGSRGHMAEPSIGIVFSF